MSGYAYDTSTTAYSVLAHAGLSVVDLDPYVGLSFSFVADSYAGLSFSFVADSYAGLSSVSVRVELLATYAGLSSILEIANTLVAEKVVGETSNGISTLSGFNWALFFITQTIIDSVIIVTKQATVKNPVIPPIITADETTAGRETVFVMVALVAKVLLLVDVIKSDSDDSTTAL